MAEITVHRPAYTRKNGTRVEAATYKTEDKGKAGKTPESEQFYHPKVEMDWHKDMPMQEWRNNALKAHHFNPLSTAYALLALSNATTDEATAREAKKDSDFFFHLHKTASKLKVRPSKASRHVEGRRHAHRGHHGGGSIVSRSGCRKRVHKHSVA